MGWKENFSFSPSTNGKATGLASEFREEYPTLAEVLEGSPAEDEGSLPIPSSSVVVFAEGGAVKFCITPRVGNRVAFGVIRDPVKGFSSLEQELAGGKFEWKTSRAKNRS